MTALLPAHFRPREGTMPLDTLTGLQETTFPILRQLDEHRGEFNASNQLVILLELREVQERISQVAKAYADGLYPSLFGAAKPVTTDGNVVRGVDFMRARAPR